MKEQGKIKRTTVPFTFIFILKGNMEFIDIPTEQTTAITDAILAFIAIVAAVSLYQISHERKLNFALWTCFFGLVSLASVLGAIAHGLKMSPVFIQLIWVPLYLSLGLSIAFFAVAAIYDFWGKAFARRSLPIMLAIGVIFFLITLVWPDSFLVFIAYESIIMVLALGGYSWKAYRRKLKGAWLIVAGIVVTIVAGAVQANKDISFTFIWPFDHNGVYHLVQMAGIGLLVAGLRKARPSGV